MSKQEQEQTQTPAELSAAKKSHSKSASRKTPLVVALVALLFALIAVAGTFYMWQQFQISRQHASAQINKLQKDLSYARILLDQQEQALQAEQRNLQALMQQNQQREGGRVLIEVNYLVKLAAFHLIFESNIILARQLLKTADQWIAMDQIPALWPLRQVFAQDIAMLDAAPTVDLPGLVARVGALSQQAEELPEVPVSVLQKKSDVIAIPDQPAKTSTTLGKLKHFTSAIGDALSNMVVVSRDNKLAPSLLTTEQRIYVVTNIQSQLTLAEWAAVHRQAAIYEQSLLQVENW